MFAYVFEILKNFYGNILKFVEVRVLDEIERSDPRTYLDNF